jgi:RNA polymerase sigma factor (sigma-70 family)
MEMPEPDSMLDFGIAQPDIDHARKVISTHHDDLVCFCQRRFKIDVTQAEDVAQEVAARVLKTVQKPGWKGHITFPYLRKAAIHLLVTQYKKEKKLRIVNFSELSRDQETLDQVIHKVEVAQSLTTHKLSEVAIEDQERWSHLYSIFIKLSESLDDTERRIISMLAAGELIPEIAMHLDKDEKYVNYLSKLVIKKLRYRAKQALAREASKPSYCGREYGY